MMGSKLVSKPGMNLPFLQEAIAALEIVEVEALPKGQQIGPAPQV